VKKVCHRVVFIESGTGLRTPKALASDEFLDDNGDLFVRYPLDDDEDLIGPVLGRGPQEGSLREALQNSLNMKRGSGKVCCSKCKKVGHNRRTCGKVPSEVDEGVDFPTKERRQQQETYSLENMQEGFDDNQVSQMCHSTAPTRPSSTRQ
jgi:hypothetical protein